MIVYDRVRLVRKMIPTDDDDMGDRTIVVDENSEHRNRFHLVLVQHALVPQGQFVNWPPAVQVQIAQGLLTEIRDRGWFKGDHGPYAIEWKSVAERLAEALRVGTAEDVEYALTLFDSTKEAMEGSQEVPAEGEVDDGGTGD